ncbi:MAG: DUF4080 domain-containing protein [Bacteroidales bacterium]
MNNKILRLLWLDLNASFAHTSLALPAIHAQAQVKEWSESVEWDVLSATLHMPVTNIVNDIIDKKPDILAATSWLFTAEMLHAVLTRVHALLPSCKIVMGGPEFLGDNEMFLRNNSYVYAVFRGEGEESLPAWLNKLLHSSDDSKDTLTDITGACYIDASGNYVDNGHAKVARFQELEAPEESPFFRTDKAFVQLETTRGCFNTCAFCTSGNDRPVRRISQAEIKRRLEFYANAGITHIRLLDRTFNANSKQAHEMLDLFESYAGKLCFHLEIHPALLGESLRQRMAKLPIGLLHLEAGIQSLRQDVLNTSKRLGSLEDSIEGLAYLCSLDNMEVHADLIAGLPLYTLQQLKEDVRTLASLKAGEIQLELLKVLPGTEMRERAKELGLIYSPLPPYEILASDGMTPADLQDSKRLSRMIDMYYNAPVWQSFLQRIIVEKESFMETFVNWLTEKGVLDSPLSLEKRGLLLFEFVNLFDSRYLPAVAVCWLKAGLPVKKIPFKIFEPVSDKILCWLSGKDLIEKEEMKWFVVRDGVRQNLLTLLGFLPQTGVSQPAIVAEYDEDVENNE